MSGKSHLLAHHLFGKPTVDDCTLQEIRILADRYPYFAPAQFLLLEKLKTEDPAAYEVQLHKAILYYPDPLTFQYFIDEARFVTEAEPEMAAVPESTGSWTTEEHTVAPELVYEPPAEEPEAMAEETAPAYPEPFIDTVEESVPEEVTTVFIPKTEAVSVETGVEEIPEQNLEVVAPPSASSSIQPEPEKVSEPEVVSAQAPQEAAPVAASSLEPTPAPVSEFTFEPFHTVDYFASQGIKLSQEDLPKDKFGKQLKSFTEWLKTMKKLPASQMSQSLDHGTENKVQHLAEDSIHQSDVWTEAMAEVWIKQGNAHKAREVYNKLSLLNPSKKAYFAAKIENLKHS
ncbi:MAG TPA: hypothetical protein VHK91_16930 [Flavisolibacter sp.]|jgi:hypothetical protein|nr:hypothetical protein [Flavisolibacter sp.]